MGDDQGKQTGPQDDEKYDFTGFADLSALGTNSSTSDASVSQEEAARHVQAIIDRVQGQTAQEQAQEEAQEQQARLGMPPMPGTTSSESLDASSEMDDPPVSQEEAARHVQAIIDRVQGQTIEQQIADSEANIASQNASAAVADPTTSTLDFASTPGTQPQLVVDVTSPGEHTVDASSSAAFEGSSNANTLDLSNVSAAGGSSSDAPSVFVSASAVLGAPDAGGLPSSGGASFFRASGADPCRHRHGGRGRRYRDRARDRGRQQSFRQDVPSVGQRAAQGSAPPSPRSRAGRSSSRPWEDSLPRRPPTS